MRSLGVFLVAGVLVSLAGCDCGDEGECESRADCPDRLACVSHECVACGSNDDCGDGAACDVGPDGTPGCYEPVLVRGNVFDLDDGSPIAGARIVAIDANGSPVSSVAISDAGGRYELGLPVARLESGGPAAAAFTLRADADGYATFPSGIRQAQPIDVTEAVDGEDGFVIESAQTDIGLLAVAGGGSIYGVAAQPEDERFGTLVVAEGPGGAVSAVADRDGHYRIFNLPAGAYTVQGYSRGLSYAAVEVDLPDGGEVRADLSLTSDATATLNGSISFANAPGDATTSVILLVESTFDETLARGDAPPGLRAPEPGTPPNISGAFTIDGIPAGRYVVLAAFENDRVVRDPDHCIGGTELVHVELEPGEVLEQPEGFKVTGALEVISPGAQGPEAVTEPPNLTWEDDSSEDGYEVTVFDALGDIVWGPEAVDRETGGTPSVPYGGPLEPGMYYQFRVLSWRTDDHCEISTTEDLKGVFYVPAPEAAE